ncbi:MFS transporter [Candidatus Gracilibacteria bacterium]|nr:MFS transporter [Candidatus Gracilibacteria bacterium]
MARNTSNWLHFHIKLWNINIIEYYAHVSLLQIGKSMTSLFIPIYLLSNLNYQIWQVMFFYFLTQIAFVPAVLFASKIIKKTGLKKAMALNLPFTAIYFWAINQMNGDFKKDILFIITFILLQSSTRAIANVANDIFMAKHVLKKAPGKMLAWLKIILTVGTLIAPLVGGVVTFFFGFEALFYSAIIIVLLSAIPLLITCKSHFEINYKPQSLIKFLKEKARPNYLIAEFGNVFTDTIMWILWPIFLFITLDNTAEIGTLVTISAIASIIVSYLISKRIKKHEAKKMIRWGVRSSSVLFFARPFFLHPLAIGTVDALYKIIDPIFRIPYDQAAYRLVMKNENLIKRANIKQLVSEIYYTLIVSLLFIFSLFFKEPSKTFFISTFLLAAIMMLLMQRMAHVKFKKSDIKNIDRAEKEEAVDKNIEIIKRGEF